MRNKEHWICRAALGGTLSTKTSASTSGVFEVWVFAMLVALAQLCGGAVVIAPANTVEYVLFFVALLAGSVIWAVVQGVVCGVITTGDPHLIEHRQTMDALNFLMADMDITSDVRRKVRDRPQLESSSSSTLTRIPHSSAPATGARLPQADAAAAPAAVVRRVGCGALAAARDGGALSAGDVVRGLRLVDAFARPLAAERPLHPHGARGELPVCLCLYAAPIACFAVRSPYLPFHRPLPCGSASTPRACVCCALAWSPTLAR